MIRETQITGMVQQFLWFVFFLISPTNSILRETIFQLKSIQSFYILQFSIPKKNLMLMSSSRKTTTGSFHYLNTFDFKFEWLSDFLKQDLRHKSNLCRIHFPLDDIQDWNVAMIPLSVTWRGNHHVFRL